ncbi:hypothetical protein KIN20_019563 [Parelaphostrongylus tenuis]|uniref:Uncharacterized protein n=1 Tax=Parelaphostrongylus tenuis TaxID=148309 RepID=A0AAD5N8V0_PARTN|nr:hypothetical protein KIN20_019563 [Parelaphostrongylus tenuis]
MSFGSGPKIPGNLLRKKSDQSHSEAIRIKLSAHKRPPSSVGADDSLSRFKLVQNLNEIRNNEVNL